jgi:hypothetical protein
MPGIDRDGLNEAAKQSSIARLIYASRRKYPRERWLDMLTKDVVTNPDGTEWVPEERYNDPSEREFREYVKKIAEDTMTYAIMSHVISAIRAFRGKPKSKTQAEY